MKAHIEIQIRLNLSNGKTLHDVLRQFAGKTKGWSFPVKPSEDYQDLHMRPAGYADCVSVRGLKRAGVAIANIDPKHPNSFRVTNIVPQECSSLTLEQYNAIGLAFAASFRQFLRQSDFIGTVSVCGPEKRLSDIIKGSKCRRLFEAWLHTPTLTSHPADIQALHVFICALFRFRSAARSYEIGQFLIEDRGWKPNVANCVVAEIEKGLEILTVNRNFHRW
jgi:hypothetical protein